MALAANAHLWPLADAQKVRFPADSSMARCPRLPRTTRIDSGTTFGRPRLRHDRSYGPSLIGLTLDRGRLCLADRRCDSANLRSAPSRLAGPAFACLAWSGGSLRPVRRLPTGVSSLGLGRAHRPGRPRHVRLLPHNPPQRRALLRHRLQINGEAKRLWACAFYLERWPLHVSQPRSWTTG